MSQSGQSIRTSQFHQTLQTWLRYSGRGYDQARNTRCYYFDGGRCRNGNVCTHSHNDPANPPLYLNDLNGNHYVNETKPPGDPNEENQFRMITTGSNDYGQQ